MAATQSTHTVEEKVAPELLVAGIREKGRYADAGARLGKVARAAGKQLAGAPLSLYYEGEFKEQDADYEAGFPVKQPIEKPGIQVHKLEGGRCVSLVHEGPYNEIGRSYERVFTYMQQKGLKPKLPSREIYLKGPGMIFRGNPKKYLTEIQILIEE